MSFNPSQRVAYFEDKYRKATIILTLIHIMVDAIGLSALVSGLVTGIPAIIQMVRDIWGALRMADVTMDGLLRVIVNTDEVIQQVKEGLRYATPSMTDEEHYQLRTVAHCCWNLVEELKRNFRKITSHCDFEELKRLVQKAKEGDFDSEISKCYDGLWLKFQAACRSTSIDKHAEKLADLVVDMKQGLEACKGWVVSEQFVKATANTAEIPR